MNIQFKKGVTELCVLSILYKGDCYGYDISELLSRYIDISDGTVYPILRKLKSDGLVTTYLSEESGGPPRKYYSITKTGIEEYLASKDEWFDFTKKVAELLDDKILKNDGGYIK